MTSLPVSTKLLNSRIVAGRCTDAQLALGYESGDIRTVAAKVRENPLTRAAKLLLPRGPAPKRDRTPDQYEAARRQKRRTAGPSELPMRVRENYTHGEQSVLVVIVQQVLKHGFCDLCLEAIGRLAGVGRTTVQNTLRKARAFKDPHVDVEFRPRPGRKHETNVIRIVLKEWLGHLRRRIGFKDKCSSQISSKKNALIERVATPERALEGKQGQLSCHQQALANVATAVELPMSRWSGRFEPLPRGGLGLSTLNRDRRG